MIKYNKCPACGYSLYKNHNILGDIQQLISKRNDSTKKLLRKISSLISNNIPADKSNRRLMQFLFGIKGSEDNVVEWGIEQFYSKRYYLSGKGYSYLSKIIQNRDKNLVSVARNERTILGSSPPIINNRGK